jgi:hypothetical protein
MVKGNKKEFLSLTFFDVELICINVDMYVNLMNVSWSIYYSFTR